MTSRNATTGSPARPAPVRARFADFELDEANATLLRDGKAVPVQPTPFALLCALVRQPGTLLTKHALLDQVWGHQFVSDSVLKTAISDLRKLLDDDPRQPRLIETVSRRGYRFVAATAALPSAAIQRTGPAPSVSREETPFIGRADALARLGRAWEAANGGRRAVVWVAGEPGIGKTMLIEHFVAGLGDIACARGQCVENYGAGEPYLPVLEALAELCRGDAAVAPMLRLVAPTWLTQLPWLSTAEEREVLRRELAGVGQDRMLREMGELLDRYTERRALLLVTEDLHWSDPATLRLIDFVARRRGSARLMWLASFRVAEVVALDHPLNPLRHELRLHGLCEEIMLDPFSEAEVAEYLARRSAAGTQDEAFVHAVHQRTDGVPLFVASVVKDLQARAASVGEGGAREARLDDVAVPENLAAIIDHYISRLGGEQRQLLSAAAICGVAFRASVVAGAIERDVVSVAQSCDALAREQLWLAAPHGEPGGAAQEPQYSFRHALFRQVLYERTEPTARAQLHGRIGSALERLRAAGVPATAAELAMHFERGRQPVAAMRYYAEAANAALESLSADACLTLSERGLGLVEQVPDGSERSTSEFALATLRGVAAAQLYGFGAEAKGAFERAYALLAAVPQHPLRVRLLHGFGFVLSQRAEYAEALVVAERAESIGSLESDPALMLATCTVRGHASMLQGRPRVAREWLERGLAAAEVLGHAPAESFIADPQVTLLGLLGIQLLHLGEVESARARLEQAYERASILGQPFARLVAIWCEALFALRLGGAQRVAALADEMHALVEKFAFAHGRAASRWFRGWADARMGKPHEGYRSIREAYEENTRLGMLAGGSETLGYAAEALLLAGDPAAAQGQLEEALRTAHAHGERVYLPQLFLIEAMIARAHRQADAAKTAAGRALAEARAQEAPWLEQLALKGTL